MASGNVPNTLKQIRNLRRRSDRLATGHFFAEGNRIVAQALAADYTAELALVAPDLITSQLAADSVAELDQRGVDILELDIKTFNQVSFRRNPSGVAAVFHSRVVPLSHLTAAPEAIWTALDGVGNAGNFGAILRTSDAIGGSGVILLGNTADPYHPDAVKASMGTIFRQTLVQAEFAEFEAWTRANGMQVIGTSDKSAENYRTTTYQRPTVLLMGSERLGLTAEQQAACDTVVSIPMVGSADSLNLSIATSLVLYEIFHQTTR